MAAQRVSGEVDPRQLFTKGESFYFTAAYLMTGGLSVLGPTGFAAITCMAFGTEVYLKVLAHIEKGEPPLDTHNLRNLFHDLPTQTQREIRREWLRRHAKELKKKMFDDGQPAPPNFKSPKTFEEALDLSAKAFVDWRYPQTKGHGWFMSGLPPLVRERILRLRPDWRPPEGSSLASLNPHPDFVKPQDEITRIPLGFRPMKNQPPAINLNIRRSTDPKDGGTL